MDLAHGRILPFRLRRFVMKKSEMTPAPPSGDGVVNDDLGGAQR